ncbi:cob(I)yrinic acid a,c-diamide adenosyltransferase [Desulfogranum mediterraneum]|uniref:cob(I)yrinic acid a,c-diamide adenosyltransferase n=1 Tax=Desulfogranum mediterraneum TaxID=160661 RepID=UPI0004132B43|nr:cob(I)yrinic acid a,c-diamide adenosyltransferase [Desulfogranum mediterraneum]
MQGYVQVYTGEGKGKTTAALGLALRAVGAGLRVYIGQFIKNAPYSELTALKRFSQEITICQYGLGCFIYGPPSQEDLEAARQGFVTLRSALTGGEYDLVIADEINVAYDCKLLSEDDLLELIGLRPLEVELVLTGRGAPARVLEQADLVTEMRPLKHYYSRGIQARKGIES